MSQSPGLRGVITDADAQAMRERIRQRLDSAIASMGERYLLHPTNRVSRRPARARAASHR